LAIFRFIPSSKRVARPRDFGEPLGGDEPHDSLAEMGARKWMSHGLLEKTRDNT